MTARQLYEDVLIELNKENAPNILLEDFNYFANKAINLYINKRYNIYDINQQTTDDLRVLKATALLRPKRLEAYDSLTLVNGSTNTGMATYYVDLPSDYLHLLNCICIYNVKKTYKCYNAGDTWRAAATRLTADAYSQVLDNFWLKPTYKRPYYYIHNINSYMNNPTNPRGMDQYGYNGTDIDGVDVRLGTDTNPLSPQIAVQAPQAGAGPLTQVIAYQGPYAQDHTNGESTAVNPVNTDAHGNAIPQGVFNGNPTSIKIGNKDISNVERVGEVRYGNVSKVRLEIRYGTDNSVFSLDYDESSNVLKKGGWIYIDYIKAPQFIRLTQEQIDYTEDKSQMLEFPDYVCQEIINELVHIIMENISDLRLQTHPVVSLSIANPAQALTPEAAG